MDTPLHVALGLTDSEFELLKGRLKRSPNNLELAMCAVMWSEHCSYKSSKIHLRKLPTQGEHVLMGPGENAGVIEVGDGIAIAIRMESHNHPSAIEPYQGAATGVGGILRDIFTVGARPVALLDSLWMGPVDEPKSNWVFKGVVRGISGYGNAVGVPTVGGEICFSATYAANPLVNVAAVGVTHKDNLVRAKASGKGNSVILIGSSTGRDGIGGVSVLASSGFSDDQGGSKRPSVQVGDPFEEKKLIEACLELLGSKMVVGIQDLGGAGLSCATSETAANAKMGMDFYLDKVPLREADMEPFEVMTSESQERMLAIVEPHRVQEVLAVCERWEVVASIVGVVTDPESDEEGSRTGYLRVFDKAGGELLAHVPAALLADEAPLYDRPSLEPSEWRHLQDNPAEIEGSQKDPVGWIKSMLYDPAWIYSQYDHQLFLNTIVAPGSDAALLRVSSPEIGETDYAMALSSDGNPRWCEIDPYWGTVATVVESAMNVAVLGTDPKALVDCLNFGNPEHPSVMWQLKASIDGMALACETLGIPVVGGNVSLYNEANGKDIFPTPVVTTIGTRFIPEVLPVTMKARQGDRLLLIGEADSSLAGSFPLVELVGDHSGQLPKTDLDLAKRLVGLTTKLAQGADALAISAIHNVGAGGVALAAIEISIASGIGISVTDQEICGLESAFCESPTQLLVATDNESIVLEMCNEASVSARVIGVLEGEAVDFDGLFHIEVFQLKSWLSGQQ